MSEKRLVEIAIRGKDESKGAFSSLQGSLTQGAAKFSLFKHAIEQVVQMVRRFVDATYGMIAEMARLGDEMDKMWQRTGETVEQLSEWIFAVERGGGSTKDLETAVRRLSRAMGDAADGGQIQAEAFARLGISVRDLVRGDGSLKSFGDISEQIADGLRDMESQTERMDIAQELFGRGGTALLPMLQEGAAGIQAMRMEMEKYGGAMSTQFASKSAEFADSQTNLAAATQRLKEALAEPFLGPFATAVNKLAESIAFLSKMEKVSVGSNDPYDLGDWMIRARRTAQAQSGEPSVIDYLNRPTGEDLLMHPSGAVYEAPLGSPAVPGRDRMPDAAADDMLWYNELLWENIRESESATEDWTRGLAEHISAMEAAEQASSELARKQWVASRVTGALDSAFYQVLTGAESFRTAFVSAIQRTFADALAAAGARAIGGVVGGVVGSIFSKSSKSMVNGSLATAPSTMLEQKARIDKAASDSYSRGWWT